MKAISKKILILVFIAFGAAGTLLGQTNPTRDGAQQEFADQQRPNLLQELGLSQNQVRQIRLMNRDRKPQMEQAQRRLREANRALDISIYSDSMDETEVAARLKDFQEAQAEVARIRFHSELALRKILTPEQLTRFRGLRERLAGARESIQNRRESRPVERRLQRLRQLPGQVKNN